MPVPTPSQTAGFFVELVGLFDFLEANHWIASERRSTHTTQRGQKGSRPASGAQTGLLGRQLLRDLRHQLLGPLPFVVGGFERGTGLEDLEGQA